GIAYLPDCGIAILVDPSNLARRQANLGVAFVARHERGGPARGAHHLGASARNHLDIMNRQAHGDSPERQAVAELRWRSRAAEQLGADLQAVGSDNIGLFAVLVLEQRQSRRAARVILDGLDRGFDAVPASLEIDQADLLFVSAADAASSDPAVGVSAAGTFADLDQALFGPVLRNVAKVRIRDVACGRR